MIPGDTSVCAGSDRALALKTEGPQIRGVHVSQTRLDACRGSRLQGGIADGFQRDLKGAVALDIDHIRAGRQTLHFGLAGLQSDQVHNPISAEGSPAASELSTQAALAGCGRLDALLYLAKLAGLHQVRGRKGCRGCG